MPTVVATVMRCGRAFSGIAAARVVVTWAGGRDGPPRLFGCCAVMIVRVRAPGRFGGPVVSDGCHHLQLLRAKCAIRGARLLWIYKSKGKEG
jgi:hypothetical protein